MGAGFLISLGVAVGVYFADYHLCHRKYLKKLDMEKREYQRKIEYNKTHLPSKELPPLSPDWNAVEEFIEKTRFEFTDEGECYSYYCWVDCSYYEKRSVPKTDFDSDTVKLIDQLDSDVDWFYAHRTGNSVSEVWSVLEGFLREKYPMLSGKSIFTIVNTYCKNDR